MQVCARDCATANTDFGVRLNINVAHCLLSHRNENSVHKTAIELGLIIAQDTLKICKHCAKSKAKQKNVQKEMVAEKVILSGHKALS
jgi:hypothetical protein